MSTVPGDGEVESTQILSEGDLHDVERGSRPSDSQPPDETVEDTRVMDDSQLRELVGPEDPQSPPEPDPAQEAAFRKQREAERAAREREEALVRVRAHRRQSADTRALRPVGAVPPESRVALSDNALDMLEREIEPSSPPPPRTAPQPESTRQARPTPAQGGTARETTRPTRGTNPIRRPPLPPPAPAGDGAAQPARMKQLVDALDEVERRLEAGDVEGALELVRRVKRG